MISDLSFKLSEDVVYRVVDDELVLIESESGVFYHFDPASRSFFETLEKPRSFGKFYSTLEPEARETLDMLIEKRIMVSCDASEALPVSHDELKVPHFLREGTERLEQAKFLY